MNLIHFRWTLLALLIWIVVTLPASAAKPDAVYLFIQAQEKCDGKWVQKYTPSNDGAVRGDPDPVVVSKKISNLSWYHFKRCMVIDKKNKADDGTPTRSNIAFEAFQLKNGNALVIEHTGWEYYSFAFTFIQPVPKTKSSSTLLVKSLLQQFLPQSNLQDYLTIFIKELNKPKQKPLVIGQDISFSIGDYGDFTGYLTYEKTGKVPNSNMQFFRITTAYGPL